MEFDRILKRAVEGDEKAIREILEIYEPMIKSNSRWRGKLDEDLKEYIVIRIIKNISKFKI